MNMEREGNMKNIKLNAVLLMSTAASSLWGGALAQPTGVAADGNTRDVIVVTARGREENLQDTPVSVSTISETTIERANIRRATDFLSLTPNVTIADAQDSGNVAINIRGVGQIRNGETPVAISVDGVLLSSPLQFSQEFFDIQQIEVLRGPQGALYGRNAIAGAINITTKKPTNEFSGNFTAEYGNGDYFGAGAAVSGALIDDVLLIRAGVSHRQSNGYIENATLGENVDFFDDTTARMRLEFQPSDAFSLDFRAFYNTRQGGAAYFARPLLQASGIPFVDAPVVVDVANTVIAPQSNNLGFDDRDLVDFSLKAEWETPIGVISSISSYSDVRHTVAFDGYDYSDNTQCYLFGFSIVSDALADCGNPATFQYLGGDIDDPANRAFEAPYNTTFQDNDIVNWSQEIRLTSPSDQRLRYIVGAYFLGRDRELVTGTNEDLGFGVIPELDFSPMTLNDTRLYFAEENDDFAYALFGQLNFDLTDTLEISFSGRYDHDKREQTDPRPDAFRVDAFQIPVPGTVDRTREASFDKFQPKGTIRWRAADNATLYFTYAQGFRSGGFNAPGTEIGPFTGLPVSDSIYRQEESTSYEFGAKTEWLDGAVTLNGAVFFGDVKDLQVFNFNGAVNAQVVNNVDEVDVFGGEVEIMVRPDDNLKLYGGFGYTDSEIKRYDFNAATMASVGNQVPFTVKTTLNAGFEHVLPLSSNYDVISRLDWERRGKTFFHEGGTFIGVPVRDPINFLSARVALANANGWAVSVWGKNLLDEVYYEEVIAPDYNYQGRPRTYGVELSVRF